MVRATRSGCMKTEPTIEPPGLALLTSQHDASSSGDSIATHGQASDMDMKDVTNGSTDSSQASDAMESLGKKSRQLIQTIQKLEALRIDATLPSLPKFVVVGDQSHGKSSIIESLCDITLPRAAGTCTRCPFRITTTASKEDTEWICEITLVYRYSYNPKSRARWTDTGAQNLVKFTVVHNKADLGAILRLAQVAILNPAISARDILDGRIQPSDGLHFSPNIISLDISAPHLPELSLFDLPGTINVHPNEDEQHLVGFIEKLVKTYLQDEKALVLLAASANQDLECSLASKFILASKATNRSMGVLTKPDLITSARIRDIRKVLEGQSFKLGGGWYITKHSSQEEIDQGISHAEARHIEAIFFQREPWTTELADFSDRFGIPNLRKALSIELTQHILNDLPEITSRVDRRLKAVKDELDTFPPESKEPCFTVMSEIDSFEAHFVEQLKGESLKNEFRLRWREVFTNFSRSLKDARPTVTLSSPKQSVISIDSDDDMEEDDSAADESPAKKSKGVNGKVIATPSSSNGTPRPRRNPVKKEDGASLLVVKKETFTLDGVRQSYEYGRASSLPEQNFKVTIDLIQKSLAGWNGIVENTLQSIDNLLLEMLQRSLDTTLEGRKGTKMYEEAEMAIGSYFKALMAEHWNIVIHYVQCERHKPVTYQQAHLEEKWRGVKKVLREARAETRAKEYMDRYDIKINSNKPDDRKKKIADIQTKLGPDEYAAEIEAVARVLAYYDLAAANLPDVVAKLLECGLLHALQIGLKTKLRKDLRALDADYCLRLLAEDPEREEKRRNLLVEQEKLNEALQELHGLSLA